MTVKFTDNAPHTDRPGSTKHFRAGETYVLSNEYAQHFIKLGVAVPAHVVETINELQPKKLTKKK